MAEAWDLAVQALKDTYAALVAALQGVSLDPSTWSRQVYLIAAGVLLLVVLLLVVRWRGRSRAQGPQFLLTNGQVVLLTDEDSAAPASGGTRQPAFLIAPENRPFQLRVTFNNLNPYPVQLLEIALRTGSGRLPVVAEASAVVPPNGAVDVVADVHDLPGERGTLQAYVFATKARPQNLRVSVPLEWEPWNLRYRVKATRQRVEPSLGVASERVVRMEKAAARRSATRQRLGSAAKGVGRLASDAVESLRDSVRAAAAARRARAEAAARERERRAVAEQPTGPISVPLPPSRRGPPARAERDRADEPGPEEHPSEVNWQEGAEETRPADAVDVSEPREEESPQETPRRRLEFPDDF